MDIARAHFTDLRTDALLTQSLSFTVDHFRDSFSGLIWLRPPNHIPRLRPLERNPIQQAYHSVSSGLNASRFSLLINLWKPWGKQARKGSKLIMLQEV